MENTKRKGNKAEAVVLAEFVKNGIPVLMPFGDNEKYDLVIEVNGEFKSVQVKKGIIRNGCVRADLRYKIGVQRLKSGRYFGKVDLIAIWSEEINKIYLIDLKNFNKSSAVLRVEPPKNNYYKSTIVWASQFEISNMVLYWANILESNKNLPNINKELKKNSNKKCSCGANKNLKSNVCRKCFNISSRKVERPNIKIVIKDVEEKGYTATGKKYGVSDNSIRKWIKQYKNKYSLE